MNLFIKLKNRVNAHPKIKQWLWFVTLWFAGLFTVLIMTAPLKWLIIMMR